MALTISLIVNAAQGQFDNTGAMQMQLSLAWRQFESAVLD